MSYVNFRRLAEGTEESKVDVVRYIENRMSMFQDDSSAKNFLTAVVDHVLRDAIAPKDAIDLANKAIEKRKGRVRDYTAWLKAAVRQSTRRAYTGWSTYKRDETGKKVPVETNQKPIKDAGSRINFKISDINPMYMDPANLEMDISQELDEDPAREMLVDKLRNLYNEYEDIYKEMGMDSAASGKILFYQNGVKDILRQLDAGSVSVNEAQETYNWLKGIVDNYYDSKQVKESSYVSFTRAGNYD